MDEVILVDENDNSIGTMEKMEAHRKGVLHRAFSILVFNSKGEMLIQKRAVGKYHSGGLWTNACCSHPAPGESIAEATRRRLNFEMGIDLEPQYAYKFIYRAPLDKDLVEHELDHVLMATFNGVPNINPQEVEDWKYIDMDTLRKDIRENPGHYTYWFRIIVDQQELGQRLRLIDQS
jgi:isopentenyl-diphosphate Delta-isomerase